MSPAARLWDAAGPGPTVNPDACEKLVAEAAGGRRIATGDAEGPMAKADVWPTIHTERKALAGDLEALTDEQWGTPSLCGEWTVRDALAHMTATAKISPPQFFTKIITSGFSLKNVQAKDIA